MRKISGTVIKGDGYGRKLGFPTINLEITQGNPVCVGPVEGVYAGSVILEDKEYKAGIAVSESGKIDAHLVDYNGDAYGKEVVFEIKKFLREYKNFDTEEELINQIKKDIELC